MGVEGNSSRFNRDASVLFILTSVGKPLFTCFGGRNNTGSLNEGVGQSGFPMVDYDGIGSEQAEGYEAERTCVP